VHPCRRAQPYATTDLSLLQRVYHQRLVAPPVTLWLAARVAGGLLPLLSWWLCDGIARGACRAAVFAAVADVVAPLTEGVCRAMESGIRSHNLVVCELGEPFRPSDFETVRTLGRGKCCVALPARRARWRH
jgi:hypothetical protein